MRRARWAPDGSRLAFQVIVDGVPRVGILDLRSEVWRDVTKGLVFDSHFGVNFDSWAPDTESILCHDQFRIYEISLDANLRQTISIQGVIPVGEVFGGNRFQMSRDRKWILFNGAKSPENTAIYLLKLSDNTLRRLTSPSEDADDPKWIGSRNQIMFSRGRRDSATPIYDLCKLSIDGGEISNIVQDASEGSYSME